MEVAMREVTEVQLEAVMEALSVAAMEALVSVADTVVMMEAMEVVTRAVTVEVPMLPTLALVEAMVEDTMPAMEVALISAAAMEVVTKEVPLEEATEAVTVADTEAVTAVDTSPVTPLVQFPAMEVVMEVLLVVMEVKGELMSKSSAHLLNSRILHSTEY